jgi:ribosomal protein S18 acetylase RimI-like enzyme
MPTAKIDFEVKFLDPDSCKKIAFENKWQANFTVDINEILEDSDLSVIAEVKGHLVYWTQIAFKTAHVDEIERRISVDSESAYVYGVYTAKNFRKVGIASSVMAKVAEHLHERGIRRIFLFVDQHNQSMLKIAGTAGFEQLGKVKLIRIGKLKLCRYTRNMKNFIV